MRPHHSCGQMQHCFMSGLRLLGRDLDCVWTDTQSALPCIGYRHCKVAPNAVGASNAVSHAHSPLTTQASQKGSPTPDTARLALTEAPFTKVVVRQGIPNTKPVSHGISVESVISQGIPTRALLTALATTVAANALDNLMGQPWQHQ
ncbi:hypothetical protein ABBQ32_013170 [Trebouxia sp. C0010 RCD-2024]